jgi:hypothetical protein
MYDQYGTGTLPTYRTEWKKTTYFITKKTLNDHIYDPQGSPSFYWIRIRINLQSALKAHGSGPRLGSGPDLREFVNIQGADDKLGQFLSQDI